MGKIIILTIALLVATPAILAADGKPVTSHDGSCQVMVPVTWSVNTMFGIGDSADKKANVAVSSPLHTTSFDTLKQSAQMVYPGDKVTKNSASEFQMEGVSMNNKPNVYRSMPIGGGKFCVVEVIYESGTVDDARKIAESLKSAK